MLKRIFIIALITGASQLFIVIALKFISRNSTAEQLESVALIDSLVLFLINAIALGLQPATMRNLALKEDWKDEYNAAQSARLTLSLVLASFSVLAIFNIYYLAFLATPLLAMNGDYALYGRGKPVAGAIIAALRNFIIFSLLVIFVINLPETIAWVYICGLFISYFTTNILIAKSLSIPIFAMPRWHNLKLYISTLSLGIVSLGLYFIGMGVMIVVPYFYPSPVVATAFVGLKFYLVFKGVLRIIQQAYFKSMTRDDVGLKVDKMSSLIGITFAAFVICFPNTFTGLFFGEKYLADKTYFMLLGIAALVYSLFSSFTTRTMLAKKDKPYAKTTLAAASFTFLVCIGLSFAWQNSMSIGISILAGELFFAAGMLLLMQKRKYLDERLWFLFLNLASAVIPLLAFILFGDDLKIFILSFLIYALIIGVVYINKFDLPAEPNSP